MMILLDWTLGFMQDLWAGPAWVFAWVMWLMVINLAAVRWVVQHKPARVVVAVFLLVVSPLMMLAYGMYGMERILGAVHLLGWTPLLAWLWPQFRSLNSGSAYHRWLRILILSNSISWVMDLLDVIRYFNDL